MARFVRSMPRMFGNLSIRPKMVGLLAVPVAGPTLLGVAGVAAGWDEPARAADARRLAAVAGQVAAAHELQLPGRRVDLLTTGEVEVAGAAAVDLVHLLAELLDNAGAWPATAPPSACPPSCSRPAPRPRPSRADHRPPRPAGRALLRRTLHARIIELP